VVDVDVVDDDGDSDVPGIVPGPVGRATVVDVGVLRRMVVVVVVVLAAARSPVTSDGSGGTAARAGAHDAQHRIPTVITARRKGLIRP
jgi:hypothetical protein